MTTNAMTPSKPMLAFLAVCFAAGALLLSGGCGSSTDPGGGGGTLLINFSPAAQGQEIPLGETGEFSVVAPDAETIAVNWRRGGLVVSNDLTYTYVPGTLGTDTLRVQVAADGVNRSYFWVITVTSTGSSLPPPVPGVAAGPGPAPGDVAVTWSRVPASSFPVIEYAVAASFDGPIADDTWDSARQLGRVTNNISQIGYEAVYTEADDGMIPGAQIWVAVRAVDDRGQMSPIAGNGFTTITTGWLLTGVVVDDMDRPVVGATVTAVDPVTNTNTDVDGLFQLGPFRNIDQVELVTTSSNAPISGWYDFHTPALDSLSGHDYQIRLITRHPLDPDCGLHDGQFLKYLRYMAQTEDDGNNPENSRLLKWASYPLTVSIPDTVNPDGVDFAAAARAAMAEWNSVMGETYFEESTDPATANLVFRFDDSQPGFFGRIRLLEPSGTGVMLGNVIPEKIEVFVWAALNTQQLATDIALHELGHTLGLLSHSSCSNVDYLMLVGGGNGDIHIDEQRAVRTIRRLPQGVDTAAYSLSR